MPGVFTVDGQAPRFPSAADHFPDKQTNVVPLHISMGAYNAMQQSDTHAYWEFNYQGTNWVHPLYELPFTGGFPDDFGQATDAFQDGEIGKLQSIVPGPGPAGVLGTTSNGTPDRACFAIRSSRFRPANSTARCMRLRKLPASRRVSTRVPEADMAPGVLLNSMCCKEMRLLLGQRIADPVPRLWLSQLT